jgi:hypothetical protein
LDLQGQLEFLEPHFTKGQLVLQELEHLEPQGQQGNKDTEVKLGLKGHRE